MSKTAKQGDTVQVHYTGRLDDGSVFDSSKGAAPLEFTVGSGQVIPGFDEAVVGMNEGDEKTVRIPANEAYGERDDAMIIQVGRHQFPEDANPQIGEQYQVNDGGRTAVVTVVEVSADSVKLDANHPLAGQALTFDLELVGVS